jgi:hypothetical protein
LSCERRAKAVASASRAKAGAEVTDMDQRTPGAGRLRAAGTTGFGGNWMRVFREVWGE